MADEVTADRPGDLTVSGGVNAADNARLHVGNIHNHTNYRYTLAKRKSDETLRSDRRNEELIRAAAQGQTPRVRYLLELQADFDYHDELDLTALHHAVLSGFEDIVSLILQRGADVNSPSLDFGTPLMLAALKQRSNIVDLLLSARGVDIDAVNEKLGTAIHCCAWTGNAGICTTLLQGSSVQDRVRRLCCEADVVFPALNAVSRWSGRNVTSTTVFSDTSRGLCAKATPFLVAVAFADSATVQLMHSKTMDLDRTWHFGEAPASSLYAMTIPSPENAAAHSMKDLLSVAYERKDLDIIGYLLEGGARVDWPDADGNTLPMRAARDGDFDSLVMMLARSRDIIPIARPNLNGHTALTVALEGGHLSCVTFLCKAGAHLDSRDAHGRVPLHHAAAAGRVKCARVLIAHGAIVDPVDDQGFSPLHFAFHRQHLAMVLCLVQAGAQCDLRTKSEVPLLRMLLTCHEREGYTAFVAAVAPWMLAAMSLDQNALRGNGIREANVLQSVLAKAKWLDAQGAAAFNVVQRESIVFSYASFMDRGARILYLLRALGGVIDTPLCGWTCIHAAVVHGNAVATRYLLALQCYPDSVVNTNMAWVLRDSIQFAVRVRNTDVIGVLTNYKADLKCEANYGPTPMLMAMNAYSIMGASMLKKDGTVPVPKTDIEHLPNGPISRPEERSQAAADNPSGHHAGSSEGRGYSDQADVSKVPKVVDLPDHRSESKQEVADTAEMGLQKQQEFVSREKSFERRNSLKRRYGDAKAARKHRARGSLEFLDAALTTKMPLNDLSTELLKAIHVACPLVHVLVGEVDLIDVSDSLKRVLVCTWTAPRISALDPGTNPLEFEVNIVKMPLVRKLHAVVFKQQRGNASGYDAVVAAILKEFKRS